MDYVLTWVLGIAVFGVVVLLLLFIIVRSTRALMGPRSRLEEELALEVLRGRLARGEITQEEFERARRALGR
jgi:uncharacterized membrane protein